MYCSSCGYQNAEGTKFCESCGQPLSAGTLPSTAHVGQNADASTKRVSTTKDTRRWLIIGGVVAAVAIVCLCLAGIVGTKLVSPTGSSVQINPQAVNSGGRPTYQEVCGDFKNRTDLQNKQNADKWQNTLVSDWTGYMMDVRQEQTPGGLGLIQLPTAYISFIKDGKTAHTKGMSLEDVPLFRAKKGDKVTFSGRVSNVEIIGSTCVVTLLIINK